MMPVFTLDKTLDSICTAYDYGIVPGSVTVFIRDSVENYGRFELTILEGVLLIIEAYEDGFLISQCIPLVNISTTGDSLKLVQNQLEIKFETLDQLLLTISPHFSQRYWGKKMAPASLTPTSIDYNNNNLAQTINEHPNTMLAMDSSPSSLKLQQQQQQQQPSSSEFILEDIINSNLFDWL